LLVPGNKNIRGTGPVMSTLFDAVTSSQPQDYASLVQQLALSRQACQHAVKECQALRTTVRTMEHTIASLSNERQELRQAISDGRATELRLAEEAEKLRDEAAKQQSYMQRIVSDHAARIVAADSRHHSEVAELKRRIEQLQVQLSLSQGSDFEQKPLTWFRMAKIESHPVHTLRDVVLSDAKREEAMRERGSIPTPGNELSANEALELDQLLLEPQTDEQRASQDDNTWRDVCHRLFLVLSERRAALHIRTVEAPVDFLLRTRSVLVAQWCQLHVDVMRVTKAMVTLLAQVDASLRMTGQVNVGDLERHLDVACSILSDVDTACHRVKLQCFSDVDKLIHAAHLPVAPALDTAGIGGTKAPTSPGAAGSERNVTPKRNRSGTASTPGASTRKYS
jgi:hypothetical protein